MPPTLSAIATTLGAPSSASIWLCNMRPISAAGMKATSRLRTKRHETAFPRIMPCSTAQNVRQYSTTTARMAPSRSEEHTSELQSLMRTSYAVFCLKQKKNNYNHTIIQQAHYQHTHTTP